MTPEERVAPIWERWINQETISRSQIEAAIRAAENDALERAAEACEAQREEFRSPQYATGQPLSTIAECFATDECARTIRALKHVSN